MIDSLILQYFIISGQKAFVATLYLCTKRSRLLLTPNAPFARGNVCLAEQE